MNLNNYLSTPERKKEDSRILLHACCAICSAYPVSFLKDTGYEVIVYFYNPNIYPEGEYIKRLEAEKTLCAHFGVKLIEESSQVSQLQPCPRGSNANHLFKHHPKVSFMNFIARFSRTSYKPNEFFDYVKGFENEPEKGLRCEKCFDLRLNKTAQKAKELGIKNFTTSILISPHKNFQKLSDIGFKIAEQYNLNFEAIDFKKKDGFLKTNKIANSLCLYRQNYCGCKFSMR